MEPESLYSLLPEQGRREIHEMLRRYLSPGAVELVTPQYHERLAREWHRERGERMLTAAMRGER